jgi:hypothetical protein
LTQSITKGQLYILPDKTFARVIDATDLFDRVTVSMHKTALDDIILIDGSNTVKVARESFKRWRLWDCVNSREYN